MPFSQDDWSTAADVAKPQAEAAQKAADEAKQTAENAESIAKSAIKLVDVQYAQNDSQTTAPTSGWSTTAPVWADGKYIWQRTVTTLGDGSYSASAPTCISGAKGADGADGKQGVSATSIVEQYYLSTSSTAQSGGSWSTTCPSWSTGHYIWTRSVCSWSDGTTTYTTPVMANGLNTANSAAYSANALATSVSQYFSHDSGGVHVMTSPDSPNSGFNSLWTATKLAFRNSTTELMTISENLIELGKSSTSAVISFCGGLGKLSYFVGQNQSIITGEHGVILSINSMLDAQDFDGCSIVLYGTSVSDSIASLMAHTINMASDYIAVGGTSYPTSNFKKVLTRYDADLATGVHLTVSGSSATLTINAAATLNGGWGSYTFCSVPADYVPPASVFATAVVSDYQYASVEARVLVDKTVQVANMGGVYPSGTHNYWATLNWNL